MESVMKVAICDDDIQVCEKINYDIAEYALKADDVIEAQIYYTGENLLKDIGQGQYYDILFLDCDLKTMSGLDVGYYIRNNLHYHFMHIYFISNYQQDVRSILKSQPMDFIPKPVQTKDIHKALLNSEDSDIQSGKKEQCFIYHVQGKCYQVPLKDILFFRKNSFKTTLVTTGGVYEFYASIENIFQELKECGFIYTDRSILVNISYVAHFTAQEMTLYGVEETLPVARARYSDLSAKWSAHRFKKVLRGEILN